MRQCHCRMSCVENISKGRGVDLFNEVVRRNLEGVVAKRKNGRYTAVSGWLKVKNPQYTQSESRYELFESFKQQQKWELPAIPKKPPLRAIQPQRKRKNVNAATLHLKTTRSKDG